jgi:hypothetical protein
MVILTTHYGEPHSVKGLGQLDGGDDCSRGLAGSLP